ncbi:uncharacterized protein LOC115923999 [Strongylocentrotus purpuratus]|uniref:Uncharacterized protein n=1 Tax=Strongylocentrotus purpuratus TaxID=7668 RepID=A0A7M7NTI0_STRPU|nr:uncharacterized protein LOC115923999 [Strongylocentrotus purpuratus]
MGSSSVPLVLYIFVKSSVQDTRQRIHENVQNVGVAFPKVDFRVHRFESNRVFDDMLDLFLKGISENDVSRLQGIIVNGFGQNPTGALGDTEFSGAFFKMVLLAMLRRRSNSSQRIAVVCAQSFSHTFTQHADSIPAESSGVFQFFPLTTSYQPYQVKPDAMARPVGLSLDFQKLIGHVFQSPSGNGFRRHNETMLGVSSIVRSDHF